MKRAIAIAALLCATCLCSAWTARTTIPAALVATQSSASVPWTPEDLPAGTLGAWWDSDNVTTGSALRVVGMADLSGNNGPAADADAAARPTRVASYFANGSPAVRFDANTDNLDTTATNVFRAATVMGAFWIGKAVSGVYPYYARNAGNAERFSVLLFGTSGAGGLGIRARATDGGTLDTTYSGVLASTSTVSSIMWYLSVTNGASAIFTNGVSAATDTLNIATNAVSDTASTKDWFGGSNNSQSALYDMAMYMLIRAPLSESNRQKLEGWAHHKYQIADQLPAAHPYRSAAPTK